MRATITNSSTVHHSDHRSMGRAIVYVESPLDKIADGWFNTYKIFNLPFKCKTWNKIKNLSYKVHIKALKDLFPEAESIKFSSKAGCRCGCSPGYILKYPSNVYGKDYWVDVEVTEAERNDFASTVNGLRYQLDLKRELASQASLV